MTIGIMGYQGGGHLFASAFDKIDEKYKFIKSNDDFTDDLSLLVMAGGESSVQADYLYKYNLIDTIKNLKIKILGTCAGMILLSKYQSKLFNGLGLLDVELTRNYYGAQITSGFYKSENQKEICFIRAPAITKINDEKIEILDTYQGLPILIKKDNIFASSFHPEIGQNREFEVLKEILEK